MVDFNKKIQEAGQEFYEYVETVQEIIPAGYVDKITQLILDTYEAGHTEEQIVNKLREEIDIFFDAEIIVHTLFIGMRNVRHLKRILKNNADKPNIYVVGRIKGEVCCNFCRSRLDGKIFKLVAKAQDQEDYNDPSFGPIKMIWPEKLYNDKVRWVRADYQHLGNDCLWEEFDPFVQKLNPDTKKIEFLPENEVTQASANELNIMIEHEKARLQQELIYEKDAAKRQVIENHLQEISNYYA
jgi:hypothetical protein